MYAIRSYYVDHRANQRRVESGLRGRMVDVMAEGRAASRARYRPSRHGCWRAPHLAIARVVTGRVRKMDHALFVFVAVKRVRPTRDRQRGQQQRNQAGGPS